MMCDHFFVIFQQTIGMDVLVSMSRSLFLFLLLYNRCRDGFKPLLLLWSADIQYSGLITLLNFLFSMRDSLLFLLFFSINLYGPTLLGFLVGCVTILGRITLSCRSMLESTWLGPSQYGRLIQEWLSCPESINKWLLLVSWWRLRARVIQFCWWGDEVLVFLFFFSLTFKQQYGILVNEGLYCVLWCQERLVFLKNSTHARYYL